MKKILGLFLASLLVASAAPAFENEGVYTGSDEEFTAPILVDEDAQNIDSDQNVFADQEVLRMRCPRGFERVPSYRWNPRRHRWELVGYTCQRERRGPGRGGPDHGGPGRGGPGRGGPGRGGPGDGRGGGGHHGH